MLVTTQLATSVYTNDDKSNYKSQRKGFALYSSNYILHYCLCYLEEYNHLASCKLHVPEDLMVLMLWEKIPCSNVLWCLHEEGDTHGMCYFRTLCLYRCKRQHCECAEYVKILLETQQKCG